MHIYLYIKTYILQHVDSMWPNKLFDVIISRPGMIINKSFIMHYFTYNYHVRPLVHEYSFLLVWLMSVNRKQKLHSMTSPSVACSPPTMLWWHNKLRQTVRDQTNKSDLIHLKEERVGSKTLVDLLCDFSANWHTDHVCRSRTAALS